MSIHGGKDNIVDNNLFIDCGTAFVQASWGQENWESRLDRGDVAKHLKERNITRPPYSTRYPELSTLRQDADRNFIWRNLVVKCGTPVSTRTDANQVVELIVLTEDPGFAAPGKLDFRLAPDAPIFARSSFRRIPFERIGLYEHELRASKIR